VFGAGRNPDFSLDGSALTWERGSSVILRRNGRTSVVGAGDNPTVTDAERPAGKKVPQWGVSYDKSGNVLLRVLRPTGGPKKTINISRGFGGTNVNGGITAYGTVRGIVTFTHTDGDRTDAYYFNEHSGNSDDTAHSASNNGEPGIIEQVTSARANFIAFSSAFNGSLARGFSCRRGCDPASVFSETQNVYFKMLVDGEAL
jgi:hypothetical protein